MRPVDKLLQIARSEIGYLEKKTNANLDHPTANAGENNWTKYARDLDALGIYNGRKNGYSWCDMFVDWCFIQAFGVAVAMRMTGQVLGGYGAGCTMSANYYKQMGRFYTSDPQPGDQVFFTKDGGKTFYHTGLVVKTENGRLYTIEGNTSSLAGVVENGGCTRDKSYKLTYSKIGGFGRPDWSLVPEIKEEDDEMTQEKFNEMFNAAMANYRKERQDNDAGAYSEKARKWAVDVGLIAGNGTEINGEPNKMWEDFVTREQLVTVLHRFYQIITDAVKKIVDGATATIFKH